MLVVKSFGPVEGQLTCYKDPPTFHVKTPLFALPFAIKTKRDRQKEEVPVTSCLCEADHELNFNGKPFQGLKKRAKVLGSFVGTADCRAVGWGGEGRGGGMLAS